MGTLGQYLQEAREGLGIDIREAAQQTRINLQYLRALEAEDFSKLPGPVFVKGFLKNYSKYLRLDEAEVMSRLDEATGKKPAVPVAGTAAPVQPAATMPQSEPRPSRLSAEPFIWGALIVIALGLFLFTSLPSRHGKIKHPVAQQPASVPEVVSAPAPTAAPEREKLYLEVSALDNTWLLIRTDASPQKKAMLKKGESLIWSADERFLLSYGSAGADRLLLNARELTVDEPKNAVVRDLTVNSSGIVSRKLATEKPKPKPQKPKPQAPVPPAAAPAAPPSAAPATAEQQGESKPHATSPLAQPSDDPARSGQ